MGLDERDKKICRWPTASNGGPISFRPAFSEIGGEDERKTMDRV